MQWQSALDSLMNSPPPGRVTIQVSSNIKSWANTPRDITVRAGDVLIVPKRASYVLVQGQVYGPTAVAYRPGKSAKWYLLQAGGTTNLANKKATFAIRADGTVIGNHSSSWIAGDWMNVPWQPGDMIVVPEKVLGGPPIWKTIFATAGVDFDHNQRTSSFHLSPVSSRGQLRTSFESTWGTGLDHDDMRSGGFGGLVGQSIGPVVPANGNVNSPLRRNSTGHADDRASEVPDTPQPNETENKAVTLPQAILHDQIGMWTSPSKVRYSDATWLVPLGGLTAALFVTDSDFSRHLTANPNTHTTYLHISDYGAYSMAGAAGTYFLGLLTHNEHQRESGFLSGEAAIDSLIAVEALKLVTGRQRPYQDNGDGQFWKGGSSFPPARRSSLVHCWNHGPRVSQPVDEISRLRNGEHR